MLSINRLYFDTNVFIALAEGSNEISALLNDLVDTQKSGEQFLFTSELCLAELLVHPYRNASEKLVETYEDWLSQGGWLTILTIDRSILRRAAFVRAQYGSVKLPDAIHIASALESACSHFLTGDRKIPDEIEGRFDHHDRSAAKRLTRLRLFSDVVRTIIEERRQK